MTDEDNEITEADRVQARRILMQLDAILLGASFGDAQHKKECEEARIIFLADALLTERNKKGGAK